IPNCDNTLQNKFVCAITGEQNVIARKHLKIKGLNGNMSSGYKLVSVNENSGESYGKTDGYISSISEGAMYKYTEALNYITSHVDSNTHKYTNMAYIDSMTVIFFATDKSSENEDEIMRFMTVGISNNSSALEPQLQTVMEHIQNGNAMSINEIVTDSSADYYVVGLVTNSSRVCIKFCYRDTFGNIFNNVLRHQRDISIVGMGDKPVTIYQLANELVRPVPKGSKETSEDVPPPLLSALMESVIMGRRYPDSLYNIVINRVKTDKDSKVKDNDDQKIKGKKTKDNDTKDNDKTTIKSVKVNARRAGLIKAYLNRNYKEDFTMALDENRKDTAYLCGRLFAVLEYIQTKAQGNELNTTIKDSYFATACTTPAVVFPQMVLLAQNHLKKIESEQARKLDNRMAWLINDIEDFPATFSNKEQGVFILGYFQQRCFRYEKNQDTDETIQ
ncbi:MAG: type I-C CRISPR-associated protein Cas8c/Csd1, partial [Huintestinicola sp.]